MTPAPTLAELIAVAEADADAATPLARLAAASATAAALDDTTDALLGHFVDQCRRAGHSWTEISGSLGVSKQAAHKRFSPSAPAMERFTGRARAAIEDATTSARTLGHAYVGTEHLLLGLFHDGEALAARILDGAGLERAVVVAQVLERAPASDSHSDDDLPYTPKATAALAAALTEAIGLGHNYIGTEHLLLGLYRNDDSLAAEILDRARLSQAQARAEVVRLLSGFTRPTT